MSSPLKFLHRSVLLSRYLQHGFARNFASSNCNLQQLVTCEFVRNGKVALIRLNAPTKMNALTEDMGDALIEEVEKVGEINKEKKHTIHTVVLTGEGEYEPKILVLKITNF